ncbi:Demethylmenaquinone methyltransferase [Escovopsis weberi]|uniref:N-methyltransferase etpN n=1 Tax=Escovopsis weberi TaxID=150374 RepID=ETPN_ESCWE|nr:Demethylmenaquinone methyltransferase [Escovopsis weberi]DAB41664.1 TPA_exp: methyltransferase [Escovopsis weberi]
MAMAIEDIAASAFASDLDEAKKAYMLPNNCQEILRMKNQHEWIKGSFGGLIKAPFEYEKKGQRILDSAAADGTWLVDLSTLLVPETELVGFDIAPELFPPTELLPANVKLLPGDLSKDLPTEWTRSFDLVHQRFIFPGFPGDTIRDFLARLMLCVKPGGWIQLVEPAADEMVSGPDPTAFNVLHKLASMYMKTPNPKDVILSTLHEGGFVNINVESADLVIGKFQENKELGIRGRRSMRDAVKNMSGMSSPAALDLSQHEYDNLVERFDEDTEKYRTAVQHTIIWAQRPQ